MKQHCPTYSTPRRTAVAAAVALALLSGCGGGGGNTRSDAPPPPPPATCQAPGASNIGQPLPCVFPPPPPATCQDPDARNFGQPGACVPRYRGVQDAVLVPARIDRVHAQGITGEGVRIGFLDGAPRPDLPNFDVYNGRFTFHPGVEVLGPDLRGRPDSDHGHFVAQTLVGRPSGNFQGGAAPGATLEWLRFCVQGPQGNDGGPGQCGGFFAAAYDFLFSRGVTIVNHSLGAQARFWEWTPAEQDLARSNAALYRQAVERDMLLMFSGGNRNEESISSNAGQPYFTPEFRRNFLAVVGVNLDAQGRPSGIAASRCMVAADWCLAAPFNFELAGPNGSAFLSGTSHSVAVVSGAAALVSQVFPWMGGRNLQTTLLTTATDLGAPGVDPVFGWGLVNAERAIRGPGQFVDEFIANVNRTGTWTFANDIGGVGGLTVRGTGNLRLTGTNTYAGLTDVQGGNLALGGSIAGSVRNGGVFTSNGGRVGSYQALPGSTTAIEVGRGLEVTGSASVDGTLRLLASSNPNYQVRDTERVLWAGALTGRFAGVTVGSGFFYSATLNYTPTEVLANLVRQSAAAAAKAAGAEGGVVAGATRMDALLDHLSSGAGDEALRHAAYSIAATENVAATMASLRSLVGEVHGTARVQAIQQVQGDQAVISDRAFDLRRVETGPAAWVQVVGRTGDLQSDGYADADLRSSGLIVGGDREIGDSGVFRVGAALSRSHASGDLDDLAGEFDGRRTGISVYGIARGETGYLSAQLGYDRMSVETARTLDLGAAGRTTVRSDRRDRADHLRIEGGIEQWNGILPYAAIGALRHRQGSFVESGAAGMGLAAGSDEHTAAYGEVGVRFDRVTATGATWRGLIGGRWTLAGRDPAFRATFAGAPVAFLTEGQRLPTGVMRAGLGYHSAERHGWSWFTEGVLDVDSEGLRDGRVGAGIRYSF